MRANQRWFSSLLKHPESTAFFAHRIFPEARFEIEKNEPTPTKMVRHLRMYDGDVLVMHGRSEVNLEKSNPALVKKLRESDQPLGLTVRGFQVRRTRVRATSRTREYHFIGDLHARVWERYFVHPKIDSDK